MITFLTILGACVAVFLIGSFAEYSVHRWMHDGKVLAEKHAGHHVEGKGQGWIGEFKDYVLPAVPLAALTYLFGWEIGVGASLGALTYGACAAYAHQVQHERPELVFWLPRPVHTIHHEHKMWHHNFGILLDVWDRVFGTYRPEPWTPTRPDERPTLRSYFEIKWR